ncbi:hypothetical protein [Rhizobium leguminosarum]
MADGSPFALACIWETRRDNDIETRSFAIVTCEPSAMAIA